MSSFLFAIGFPLSLFFVSILLLKASTIIQEGFEKPYRFIAYTIMGLSLFYVFYTLIPIKTLKEFFGIEDMTNDLPRWFYSGALLVLSAMSIIILKAVNVVANRAELKFKGVIDRLINFLVEVEKKYIHSTRKNQFYNEFVNELDEINKKL